MARQRGIHKLKGTLGEVIYFGGANGDRARTKGTLDRNRILNDKAFERTRENAAEFGRAGKAVKLLRDSFRILVRQSADAKMTSRLLKELMRVIKADATSIRGERNVMDGEAVLLEGFDFNSAGRLSSTLFVPYSATVDRETGVSTISIPAFNPALLVAGPQAATHFTIVGSVAAVDFGTGSFRNDTKAGDAVALSLAGTKAIIMQLNLPPNVTHPIFLALGMFFYQEVNGVQYALNNGAFNAVALIKVDA